MAGNVVFQDLNARATTHSTMPVRISSATYDDYAPAPPDMPNASRLASLEKDERNSCQQIYDQDKLGHIQQRRRRCGSNASADTTKTTDNVHGLPTPLLCNSAYQPTSIKITWAPRQACHQSTVRIPSDTRASTQGLPSASETGTRTLSRTRYSPVKML